MQDTYAQIGRSINGRMLANAIRMLRPWMQELDDAGFNERLHELEHTYQLTADLFFAGKEDLERSEMLDHLARQARLLLDDVYLKLRLRDSLSYEFREMLRPLPENPATPEEVFNYFWLRNQNEADWDYNRLQALADDPEKLHLAMMAVSGVTLNLMRTFSEYGFQCLMRVAEEKYATEIRERAWVGLLLALLVHDDHLSLFPDLQERLMDLTSTEDGRVFACTALTCIVRTLGVEWATQSYRSLQERLTPLVRKFLPELTKDDVVFPDQMELTDNPIQKEVNEVIDSHRREMMRLYKARLDAHFGMFSDMYTTPFFQKPYRWFLPYSASYLPEELQSKERFLRMMPSGDMCDSDRYAFISSMAKVGRINGMDIDEVLPDEEPVSEEQGKLLTNDYVRQIYRFFRLNPWQIESPFELLNHLSSTHVFELLNPSAMEKVIIAEHCYLCHAWDVAGSIYAEIDESLMTAAQFAHYGKASEECNQYDLAVKLYLRSLEMTENEHVREALVRCYVHIEKFSEAMEQVDILLAAQPKNRRYLTQKAYILSEIELFSEALEVCFRLDLYYPDDEEVQNDILWYAWLVDDMDTVESYYQKLLSRGNLHPSTYINYGHVCFSQGRRMEAFGHYQQALRAISSLRDFLRMFRPDRKYLIEKGISKPDVYLMEDQLIMISNTL